MAKTKFFNDFCPSLQKMNKGTNSCDNVPLFFMSLSFICYFFQITGLIVFMLLSWLFVSLIFMLVPVFLGRQIFALWFDENPRVYELYTSAMGLYTCLLLIRGATLFAGWLQQGWLQLSQKLREWAKIVSIWRFLKTFLKLADHFCLSSDALGFEVNLF